MRFTRHALCTDKNIGMPPDEFCAENFPNHRKCHTQTGNCQNEEGESLLVFFLRSAPLQL